MSCGCGNRNVNLVTMGECLLLVNAVDSVGMRRMRGRMLRVAHRVVRGLLALYSRWIWGGVVRGVDCLTGMRSRRLMMMVCR